MRANKSGKFDDDNIFEGESFHSGFVPVIGKPNVGKSTLVNSIVGEKVAITSHKPQTTRHRIMGVKNGDNYQIVFVDTPGVHKPEHELGKFMEKTYKSEMQEADLILFVADASSAPSEEDFRARDIIYKTLKLKAPVFLVLNKSDMVNVERMNTAREEYASLGDFRGIYETSAVKNTGIEKLVRSLSLLLPPGPPYFPADMHSDQSAEFKAAEIVREKVLLKTRQEIPHSVFVHTEELREGAHPGEIYIKVFIYVERKSQKGILIGKSGLMLKKIGTLARQELEEIFGKKVFLDLWVKIKEDWKDRKDLLKSWGYVI